MSEPDPAELLAATNRALKWAGFLLGAMLLILVIDLQLKRSLARQAVNASAMIQRAAELAELNIRGGPRGGSAKDDRGVGHPGDAGVPGLVGDAALATGTVEANGAAAGIPDPAPAGPRKRAPRDGGRASGPEAGS